MISSLVVCFGQLGLYSYPYCLVHAFFNVIIAANNGDDNDMRHDVCNPSTAASSAVCDVTLRLQ